ncbi:MAG TPA: hypothetical protein VIZ28_11470, partial [Chitinophagaceae bacterium]
LTINARNKTNNFALLITDIGNGDAACRMIGASGGSLDLINFNYGHSPTWKYTNKHAKWMVNNNAFDGSSESYTFEHENQAPTVALMLLKGQASQTGDMLKVKNSSGIDLFRILSDGKGYFAGGVSIGTTVTDAAYKLWVEGSIRTRKVRVDQGAWPDYVFHHNYPLLPLSEVEKFIQQNNHLPEVPSAKEVEENGLDLGDNQATLLKKVEELTLYLIEQNKKIEQLQKEVDTLKKQK